VVNPLNSKLNPICHLLALLRTHHILHVSRIRVNLLFVLLYFFNLFVFLSLFFCRGCLGYIYIYIYYILICVLEKVFTTSVQIVGHSLPEMSILNMVLDLVTSLLLPD